MNKPSGRAMAWKSVSPWFGVDEKRTEVVFRLHKSLLDDGIKAESEEYWNVMFNFSRQVELGFCVDPTKFARDKNAWYFKNENALWLDSEVSRIADIAWV